MWAERQLYTSLTRKKPRGENDRKKVAPNLKMKEKLLLWFKIRLKKKKRKEKKGKKQLKEFIGPHDWESKQWEGFKETNSSIMSKRPIFFPLLHSIFHDAVFILGCLPQSQSEATRVTCFLVHSYRSREHLWSNCHKIERNVLFQKLQQLSP